MLESLKHLSMASFTAPPKLSNGCLLSRSHCLLVCGYYCYCIFSFSLLLSKPTFSVASSPPDNTPTSTPPLKTAATINTTHRLLIALTSSALLLTCILLMAYFSCLRFKIKRKIRHQEEGKECELEKTHVADTKDSILVSQSGNLNAKKDSVWRFGWDEIEHLTMNFSSVIGEGGFSTVYLSLFSDLSLGAVKIHTNSERLSRVFKQELDVLMQLHHENIVQLIGYCDEREEGVLVFEYISNGTLHDKLHGPAAASNPLPWNRRMSIAFQLARAIEYLHDSCSLQIIHCDIKASNILLDDQLNCKLCDFGCAKMGFSSTVVPSSMHSLMGSPGYVDPHYMRNGIISKKNDVYSFGVLVLELITGIEAFCTEKQQLLTSVVRPILRDPAKVMDLIDSRLAGEFNAEEATAMASISALCLQGQPSLRPSMAEILRIMQEKIQSISFLPQKSKENRKGDM